MSPGGWVTDRDEPVLRFVVRHRTAWLTAFMRFITHAGSSAVLVPLAIVVAVVLVVRRARRAAVQIGAVYLVANLSFQVVKRLTGRRRPPARMQLVHATGSSFPSGHATQIAAFCVTIAFIACAGRSRTTARVIWLAAIVIIMLVGASRVYLGVHWLSDVLAGWILGTACALAGKVATGSAHRRARP